MSPRADQRLGFTLVELLVVVAILGLLLAILLPSFGGARKESKSVVCLTNLRTPGQGWGMYADEYRDGVVPARLPEFAVGGIPNPENHYRISTGMKFRPRWPALIQAQVCDASVGIGERPRLGYSYRGFQTEDFPCPESDGVSREPRRSPSCVST